MDGPPQIYLIYLIGERSGGKTSNRFEKSKFSGSVTSYPKLSFGSVYRPLHWVPCDKTLSSCFMATRSIFAEINRRFAEHACVRSKMLHKPLIIVNIRVPV